RESGHGIGPVTYAVGKLGEGVHQAAVIGGGGAYRRLAAIFSGAKRKLSAGEPVVTDTITAA
ncbi:MAG TPA: hypothetical protein VML19_21285, partial [Verrucomicrobiae bacterium]|nr:hypothetical protein [Verrucomicrobiae bacterium]